VTDPDESLALTICRLGLDPATGRIRHPATLGIAIRSGLFVDLALAGRVVGSRAPQATGAAVSGARMPDALYTVVAQRGTIRWKRWFSHTDSDVGAATRALIEAGVWEPTGTKRFRETNPGEATERIYRVRMVMDTRAGSELRETVVAVLAAGSGLAGSRPRPRTQLSRLRSALVPVLPADPGQREAIYGAVRAALQRMRGRSVGVFSR
jgi:hypothetical protein